MLHFLSIFIVLLIILTVSSSHKFADCAKCNTNRTGLFFCMLILCFLASFRSYIVGNDTESYIHVFHQCEDYLLLGSRFEIGYVYLNVFLKRLCSNPQIVFVVSSIFIYFSFTRFIWKYSRMPWLSMLVFFMLVFGSTVNIMRQCIAVAVLLYGVDFIIQRKLIPFVLSVVIAFLFHYTAVFFVFAWFLPNIKLNGRTLFVFASLTLFCYTLFSSLLSYAFSYFSMYEYYSDSMYFEGEARTATMIQIAMSFSISLLGYVSYYYYTDDEWKKAKKDGQIVKLLILIQFVATVIYVLCLKLNLLDRVAFYYSVFSFVSLANAISLYPIYVRKRLAFGVVLFLLTYSCIIIVERPNWNRVFPYEFCWNDN